MREKEKLRGGRNNKEKEDEEKGLSLASIASSRKLGQVPIGRGSEVGNCHTDLAARQKEMKGRPTLTALTEMSEARQKQTLKIKDCLPTTKSGYLKTT